MPILTDQGRKTKKIVLPSSTKKDEAWVEVYETVLTRDIVALSSLQEDQGKATITALTNIIKAWNFTDMEGKAVEVTVENVELLDFGDMLEIVNNVSAFNKLTKLTNAKKKN